MLVFLNAFFVAAEFALVKIRMSQLEALADEGNARAAKAQAVVGDLDAYLSRLPARHHPGQSRAWLGWRTFSSAELLQPFLCASWESASPALITSISFIVAFSIITFLPHRPWRTGARRFLPFGSRSPASLLVSGPLRLFYFVFKPAIWLSECSRPTGSFGISFAPSRSRKARLAHSEEELRVILDQSEKSDEVSSDWSRHPR